MARGSGRSEGSARADRPAFRAEILGSLLTPTFVLPWVRIRARFRRQEAARLIQLLH